MNTLSIESIKTSLQMARDAARELRLSGASESEQDAAYEEVYQLRCMLDDVIQASHGVTSCESYYGILFVYVGKFKFEFKMHDGEFFLVDDCGNPQSAQVAQKRADDIINGVVF